MLSYFKIRNFKSIVDLKIDFSFAEGKAPNGYLSLPLVPFLEDNKMRIVPILSFYGPNACGKTNILNALSLFKQITIEGLGNNFFPNKLNPHYENTDFELEFLYNNEKFNYEIEYNNQEIQKEILKLNDIILYSINNKQYDFDCIATDQYKFDNFKNIIDVECSDENKFQKYTFLSKLKKNYPGLNSNIIHAFNYIIGKLEIYPKNRIAISQGIDLLAEGNSDNERNNAFSEISSLLQKLDIDIVKMTLEHDTRDIKQVKELKNLQLNEVTCVKVENENLVIDLIQSYHKDVFGNEINFNFSDESDGTKVLSGLLGIFLSALKHGKVLVIDELECSLHPILLNETLKLFKDRRYNTNNAQLVFTTHNTDILDSDVLRVSEVSIVDKTVRTGTTVKRLSEFEGIRNVNNFRKQYLNGMFSGIPYPYI